MFCCFRLQFVHKTVGRQWILRIDSTISFMMKRILFFIFFLVLFVEHFQCNEKSNFVSFLFSHLSSILFMSLQIEIIHKVSFFFLHCSVRLKDFAVGHIITSYFRRSKLACHGLSPENPQNKQIERIASRQSKRTNLNTQNESKHFILRFSICGI